MPRDRLVIASCILLITALAWAHLIQLDRASAAMMPNMPMTIAPWSARDFAFTFAMWSVMMIGMMTATALPVLLLFSKMQTSRVEAGAPINALYFGLGYVAVWVGFSAAAAFAQWGLHSGLWLSPSMAVTSSRFAGVILIAAGAYQLSPAKGACLKQCQSPLGFLLSHWRSGAGGALRMGLQHGMFCLGCCWALMLVLFVVGVMNLIWVAVLTVFILVEKFGRGGALVARVGGLLMMGLGFVSILSGCIPSPPRPAPAMRPIIIAHRGASGHRREHTLASSHRRAVGWQLSAMSPQSSWTNCSAASGEQSMGGCRGPQGILLQCKTSETSKSGRKRTVWRWTFTASRARSRARMALH